MFTLKNIASFYISYTPKTLSEKWRLIWITLYYWGITEWNLATLFFHPIWNVDKKKLLQKL